MASVSSPLLVPLWYHCIGRAMGSPLVLTMVGAGLAAWARW